ncbi:MAG TPA: zf-HC2 domain-containing protein [Bryobacteraceae bacterium]|nr:zf-HC2 domain-containing protein [Bryobacteraceae bacterium]
MAHGHQCGCKDVFAMLSEYLDRELTAETCAELEEHLADCPPCIEFLNSLKKTVGLCKDCAPPDVPPPPLSAEARDKMLAAYRTYLSSRQGC